jgi:hypothetical protein
MPIRAEHDMHRRRFSRNLGVGLALLAFVAIVFALSVVKIRTAGPVEGFDHQPRATALPVEEGTQ